MTAGMFKCQACNFCQYILESNRFKVHDYEYKLNLRANCNSRMVIYLAMCQTCTAFYVGKTERRLRDRIYEHTYVIRKQKLDNALAKHISVYPNHMFKFLIIDQITQDFRGAPLPLKLEERELFWQIRLNAYSSPGLNENCSLSSVLKLRSLNR